MQITLRNFQKKIPISGPKVLKAAKTALQNRDIGPLLQKNARRFSIVFVGTRRMQSLNKKYLNHDYVTDVLTFDLGDTGEIVICPQVALANARKYQVPVEREINLYVIHGLLHLAGYDDHTQAQQIQMRRMEERLL